MTTADHDHNREVAAYGECITCATRTERQAEAARDAAVAGVATGAPEQWMAKARRVVRELADGGADFTADDVWARLPQPPEPRALGAVMTWAADQHLIVATDRTVPSRRPENHARPSGCGPQLGPPCSNPLKAAQVRAEHQGMTMTEAPQTSARTDDGWVTLYRSHVPGLGLVLTQKRDGCTRSVVASGR